MSDLPYSSHLRAEDGTPAQGADFDTAPFEEASFDGARAGGARFAESAFTGVDFGDAHMRRSRSTTCGSTTTG